MPTKPGLAAVTGDASSLHDQCAQQDTATDIIKKRKTIDAVKFLSVFRAGHISHQIPSKTVNRR
jgi:hypothetical protein